MIDLAPIIFHPYLKSVIWGGEKICRYKNIPQPQPKIGESWEISAVPGHESIVAYGKYKGWSLTQLIDEFGEELLGKKVTARYGKKFPLLVKIIDANDNLSVQVHPDDNLAMERHNSLGKTEMWYIISADKNAKIYAGFKMQSNPEDYVERISNGTFTETLAIHDSYPDDVFFLPAGRVHAIGAGNLLAEIQESSDITYRIYDYDRTDSSGNKRELHTREAKDAIDYTVYSDYKEQNINSSDKMARLVSCDHFKTYKLNIHPKLELSFDSASFTILMCLQGSVTLKYPSGEMELKKGHTVLLPSSLTTISLSGDAKMLMAHT